MNIEQTSLEGVLVISPKVFGDERGFFTETYRQDAYAEHGMTAAFVQDNHSFSGQGILRGLHAQYRRPQGKLVRVLAGEVFDVVADARPGSPTHGQWFGEVLSGENFKQLYVPPGYLHGFCVLSESAHFLYKCTDYYDPEGEITVSWNDPHLAIDWPVGNPKISDKDAAGMSLGEATTFLASL